MVFASAGIELQSMDNQLRNTASPADRPRFRAFLKGIPTENRVVLRESGGASDWLLMQNSNWTRGNPSDETFSARRGSFVWGVVWAPADTERASPTFRYYHAVVRMSLPGRVTGRVGVQSVDELNIRGISVLVQACGLRAWGCEI